MQRHPSKFLSSQYDDTILNAIDQLMVEAHAWNIKLLICVYDSESVAIISRERKYLTGISSFRERPRKQWSL